MLDLNKTRVLAMSLSLAFLAGCGTTDTQPDDPADPEMTGDTETTTEERADGEAYGTGEGTGVAEEDMTEEERAAREERDREEMEALREQNTVYFDFDSSDIRRESREVLEAHAQYLSENTGVSVVLEGHTDERGSKEYNMALGERRSESVERFLNVNGVSSDAIETVSYGEERPAVDESNEEAWAQNRRVEIVYE